jgi:MYXO-CTERM domain-containing protein
MKSSTGIGIAAGLLLSLGLTSQAMASFTVQDYWAMGEDGSVLPTDSVGGKNFTGQFSTAVSSAHSPWGGSTASIAYNGFAGTYMNSPSDDISVPTTNWVLEVAVDFTSLNGQVNIASLGTDTSGTGADHSWAKIGFSGNNFFFGRENDTYGVLSDVPVVTNTWYELAYAQFDGIIHGYVNGVEATDLNYGDDAASYDNNGQINIGVKPGGGQNLDGNLDNLRFSTFSEGGFSTSDLMLTTPEPAPMAALGLGVLVFMRRRRSGTLK